MPSTTSKVGRDLTTGSVLPLLFSFALPMILTSLVQQTYSMVDLIVIGKFVGSIGTVGVSTGGELSDMMTPIANGLATAGQIYIAQLVGARNHDKLRTVTGTLFTIMGLIAIAITVVTFICYRQFLIWLNCPAEAFDAAAQYMLITVVGMPFIFGYNAVCAVLRGMGESKRPLMFVVIAATINIFLDLLLVVVFHLDAAGTAIATVMSQIGAFAASYVYLYRRREQIGLSISTSYFRINRYDAGIIFRLGIPQMIRVLSVHGSMLWVKSNINAFGLTVSATYSVGSKIEKFMNIFMQGIDQAGGAMIGQNLGARKPERVREIMRKMLMTTFAIGIVCAALFWLVPNQLYMLFTDDADVIAYGEVFLQIMSVGCLVVGYSGAMKSISTGAGAAMLSLSMGVMDGVSRILVCLFADYALQQGAQSYFWGAALCQLLPGVMAMCYYLSGQWERKKLLVDEGKESESVQTV